MPAATAALAVFRRFRPVAQQSQNEQAPSEGGRRYHPGMVGDEGLEPPTLSV